MRPKVSVIIPAFNAERSIERCVLSALKQSYTPIEVIAINDCSSDATGEILDRLQRRYDNLVVLHQPSNQGASHSRNLGISAASGIWVTFLDADDYLLLEYVRGVIYSITDEDFICTPYREIHGDSKGYTRTHCLPASAALSDKFLLDYLEEYFQRPYIYTAFIHCWNKFFYRETLIECAIEFDEQFTQLEDVNFVFQYLRKTEKGAFVNIVGVCHNKGCLGNNLSAQSGDAVNALEELKRALEPVEAYKQILLRRCNRRERVSFQHFRFSMVVLFCIRISRRFRRNLRPVLIKRVHSWLRDATVRTDAKYFLYVPGESRLLWFSFNTCPPCISTLIIFLLRR